MSKGMIGFIIVAVVGLSALLIIQMKRSAADAEKRSGNIMEKFKMIDKDLQKTKTKYDSIASVPRDTINSFK